MKGASRFLVALLIAGATTSLLPAANAHTGPGAAFNGAAGPFTVYAFDGRSTRAPGVAEYRVLLLRDATPVDDARVSAVADLLDIPHQHIGPVTATATANIYTFPLPDHGVVPWRVRVTVRDRGASAAVSFEVHGTGAVPVGSAAETPGGRHGTRVGLAVASIVGLVALLVAVVVRRTSAARERTAAD